MAFAFAACRRNGPGQCIDVTGNGASHFCGVQGSGIADLPSTNRQPPSNVAQPHPTASTLAQSHPWTSSRAWALHSRWPDGSALHLTGSGSFEKRESARRCITYFWPTARTPPCLPDLQNLYTSVHCLIVAFITADRARPDILGNPERTFFSFRDSLSQPESKRIPAVAAPNAVSAATVDRLGSSHATRRTHRFQAVALFVSGESTLRLALVTCRVTSAL